MLIAPPPSRNNELLINSIKDAGVAPVGAPTRTSTRPCAKRTQPKQSEYLLKESRRVIFPSLYKRPAQVHALSETSPNSPDVFPSERPSPIVSNRRAHHVPELSSRTLKGHHEEMQQPKMTQDTLMSSLLALFKRDAAPSEQHVTKSVSAVSVECTIDNNRNDSSGDEHCSLPREDHFLPAGLIIPEIEAEGSWSILPVIQEEVITTLSEPEISSPTKNPKPLRSILRSKMYPAAKGVTKIPSVDSDMPSFTSVDSDMPSLASSVTSNGDEVVGVTSSLPCKQLFEDLDGHKFRPVQHTRSLSTGKYISFDARVWVCEFERVLGERETTWYNGKDLDGFKQEAVQRILEYTEEQSKRIPSSVSLHAQPTTSKQALFSHAALQAVDGEVETTTSIDPRFRQAVLENEIRNILLVDPHDICLKLFTKALKSALPHVTVTACTSSEKAMEQAAKKCRFDIVIIEERLKIFHRQHRNGGATERNGRDYSSAKDRHASGSALLRSLSSAGDSKSVFVGVSARLAEDGARLKESGADFCWAKPPPPINQVLMDDLLKALLLKRGRSTVVKELFG